MGSVSAIRAGLKTRLDTITGLNTYAVAPGQPVVPAAIVLAGPITFDDTMSRGSDILSFDILLLVQKATDSLGQEHLDPYLAGSGSSSIKAAVEGDATLGGEADWTVVTGVSQYGDLEYANVQYLGARFTVEVNTDGS